MTLNLELEHIKDKKLNAIGGNKLLTLHSMPKFFETLLHPDEIHDLSNILSAHWVVY